MKKSKVVIIEDEFLARQRLKKLLAPYDDQIVIIGEAANGEEGLELIERLEPDFIFLDIEMPIMNGFDMILKLSSQPYIIFSTAYDEYAVQAFEENSIDYLLKPIRPERLKMTIDKIHRIMKTDETSAFNEDRIKLLIQQMEPEKKLSSITVHSGDKIIIVNLDKIVFFNAEDKMTVAYSTANQKHLLTQSLNQLEEKLPDDFMRINRSSIINRNMILEIRKGFKGKLVFYMDDENQTKLTSGATYNKAIRAHLKF